MCWLVATGAGSLRSILPGEVHSINKRITGQVAGQVRERLADIELDELPSVDQARALQKQRLQEKEQAAQVSAETVPEPPRPEQLAAVPQQDQVQPRKASAAVPLRPYEKLLKLVNVAIRAVEAVADAVNLLFEKSSLTPQDELRFFLNRVPLHENSPDVR
jgi:hypothetical protein